MPFEPRHGALTSRPVGDTGRTAISGPSEVPQTARASSIGAVGWPVMSSAPEPASTKG